MKSQLTILLGILCSIYCLGATLDKELIINFDNNWNPVYPEDSKKVILSAKNTPDTLTSVPGKFGKAVRIKPNIWTPLGYDVSKVLRGKSGTIELWFKPEFSWNTKSKTGSPSFKNKYLMEVFFQGGEGMGQGVPNCGVAFIKNQYGVYSFAVVQRYEYKYAASAALNNSNKFYAGKWYHLAASWDTNDARIFLNGKLIGISPKWELNYFPKKIFLQSTNEAGMCFDELIVSSEKKYIASFPLPKKACVIPPPVYQQTPYNPVADTNKYMENKTIFSIDFSNGLTANYAQGLPFGWTNRPPEFDKDHGLRIKRFANGVDDILAFSTKGNLHSAIGAVELTLVPNTQFQVPATLFEVFQQNLYRQIQGMTLRINHKKQLVFKVYNFAEKPYLASKVVTNVISKPLKLVPGQEIKIGAAWKGTKIQLYCDGKSIATATGAMMPSILGKYFFVGASTTGKQSFEGWIKRVTIKLKDKI